MDRRQVIAGLATGAAAAALPDITRGAEPPACGLAPEYFPNVAVLSHEGRRARFYEDLIRDRIVLVQFLSVRQPAADLVAEGLAKVQALLGDRMGREIFFYSITTDPAHETPRVLADFAERHGAGPGWLFLTGEPADLETLRSRFFVHDGGAKHAHNAAPVEDCSQGLLRYGNAAAGLWGAVPARSDPRWIAERLFWVQAERPAEGPRKRRGPLPRLPRITAVLLSLGLLAGSATAQTTGSTDPYQHPHPQALLPATTISCDNGVLALSTGTSPFPPSQPFLDPPGTNLLPTVYTDLLDATGKPVPNTLPSTPTVPYNLLDGQPVVTRINPTSPINDLRRIFDLMQQAGAQGDEHDREAVRRAIRTGVDILEGNPVPNRAYSGLPVLHYTGPEKSKQVVPIKDAQGNLIGGNLDVHQIWFGGRIESDTAMIDPSTVPDVPWTITYTVDVLDRGEDDFSPFVIYMDPSAGKPIPWAAMDQTFFPMEDGTRTVFKVKMAPGRNYSIVYTWGWRMHPPRAQAMDTSSKPVTAFRNPCDPSDQGIEKTVHEWEVSVFGPAPRSSEQAKLAAIARIGDLAPEKQMWNALRQAHTAAEQGKWEAVSEQARKGKMAYFDWIDRTQLPGNLEPDPDSDLTLLYVNNTIYGEFTRGTLTNLPDFQTRGYTARITLLNGDNFEHGYQNVDFGGARGWENQFKSSVKVGGSGCWFTFGRVYWSMLVPKVPLLAPAQGLTPSRQKVRTTYNFDPSTRLRFYQFDPLHHDVAIFSVH
jgi:cytochrome oxidase Cu insertion factor (SCO1/SenC/PrrC family)